MDRDTESTVVRWAVVAGLGVVTVWISYLLGIPGAGAFLLIAGAAGLVAAAVAPGLVGYVVLLSSIAVACLAEVAFGSYAGLVAIVIGALWLPATAGWLLFVASRRAMTLGMRSAARDARTVSAFIGVVLIVTTIGYVALAFSTSPP